MEIRSDQKLIDLFCSYDATRLDVALGDGRVVHVWNIAWGYDLGDDHAHVTTNASPFIDGEPLDFFFTHEIVAITDAATGTELFRR